MSACHICKDTGVLIGQIWIYDEMRSFDADHVARCDSCAVLPGDLEAVEALASRQQDGAWIVWVTDLMGELRSTEAPEMYVRASPGDAAALALSLYKDELGEYDECPDIFVHVKYIEEAT